ncbi:hypothetical protein BST16_06730 [Mycobacterium asiaticum DSM 44297]|nr:hypothetical protein BST16_06730 [Mycobacterium asiaticum DSM 44297]
MEGPTSDGTALLWLQGVGEDVTIKCEDTIEDGEWYRSSPEIGILDPLTAWTRRQRADWPSI